MTQIAVAIQQLESHRSDVDRALEALRVLQNAAPENAPAPIQAVQPQKKHSHARKTGMTPEGRRKLSQSMKKRWAKAKTAGLSRVA